MNLRLVTGIIVFFIISADIAAELREAYFAARDKIVTKRCEQYAGRLTDNSIVESRDQ